jgi:hypothetical protein
MANKKKVLISILSLTTIILIFIVGVLFFRSHKTKSQNSQSLAEKVIPTISTSFLTHYSNEEFGFSLAYPVAWNLPQETKITPPQQHLYQIVLNPGRTEYFVDIYHQMMPLPLANFVRDYFPDVSWSGEQKINGQDVVKFFLPQTGLEPAGAAGVAFAKGNDILVISTPVLKGEKEKVINDPVLKQIAESFVWQNTP